MNLSPDEICALSAAQLSAAYANGSLSPTEALSAATQRALALNPCLRAFYFQCVDAFDAAEASTDRWSRGRPLSPVDGVPISVKDSMALAGTPSYLGSRTRLFSSPPSTSEALVARFQDSGAIPFAKTTMVETGLFAGGFSELYGSARNPWNLSKTPGGSSSGAASAAAAYLGPVHLGTDGGGSLRSPAALCGVVSLKATGGAAPFSRPIANAPWAQAVSGFITRTVEDQLFVFDALLAAPQPHAQTAPHVLIGFLTDAVDDPAVGRLHPDLVPIIDSAVARVAAAFPVEAVDDVIFDGAMWEGAVLAAFADLDRTHYRSLPQSLFGLAHPVVRHLVHGVRTLDETRIPLALEVMTGCLQRAGRRLAELFERFDVLIVPTNYFPAQDADLPWPEDCPELSVGYGWGAGPCPHVGWAFGGPPAVNLPVGLDRAGVPVGLTLIGRPGTDRDLLRIAAEVQNHIEMPPQPWSGASGTEQE